MQPVDLIQTARLLVKANRGKPSQANLRRAVSTAYYALFHALARNCADMLIGGVGAAKSKHAWLEVYRSVAHGSVKSACEHRAVIEKFPNAIVNFALAFVELQSKRHDADYNPFARFYKSDVLNDIETVVRVIEDFERAPVKDRRAFASWVLFKNIKRNS